MMYHFYLVKSKEKMQKSTDSNKPLQKYVKKFIVSLTTEALSYRSYTVLEAPERPYPNDRWSSRPEIRKNEKPLCLWKPQRDKSIHHKLSKCNDRPKEEKEKCYEDLRNNRKEKNKNKHMKGKKKNASKASWTNSARVLFGATLGGKVNRSVCVYIGADSDLIDNKLFQKIANRYI